MTGESTVPRLEDYLASPHAGGGCTVCKTIPPELRAQIKEHVDRGTKAWAAYARFLNDHGFPHITRSMVDGHFNGGHDG